MEDQGNQPAIYNFRSINPLQWRSGTVDWMPLRTNLENGWMQRIIVGSDYAHEAKNYLVLADVKFSQQSHPATNVEDEPQATFPAAAELIMRQRINHPGTVYKARHMPQNHSIVATMNTEKEIMIFDMENNPGEPTNDEYNPEKILVGNVSEGCNLSWSPVREGFILSSARNGEICLYDINANPENISIHPLVMHRGNRRAVEDIDWHRSKDYLYGSVGADKYLRIWDIRLKDTKAVQSTVAHNRAAGSLSFSRHREDLIATCSTDRTIKLFDLRMLNTARHVSTTQEENLIVSWSPVADNILASSSSDGQLMLWDYKGVRVELTGEVDSTAPELLGELRDLNRIRDFSISTMEHFLSACVDSTASLKIWVVKP